MNLHETILAARGKGPNYELAARLVEGRATVGEYRKAARLVTQGVRASKYLQAAIDCAPPAPMPAVSTAPTVTRSSKRKADPVKAARWAQAVKACEAAGDPAYGPNGGPTPQLWTAYRATKATAS